jgi:hypothetical protein
MMSKLPNKFQPQTDARGVLWVTLVGTLENMEDGVWKFLLYPPPLAPGPKTIPMGCKHYALRPGSVYERLLKPPAARLPATTHHEHQGANAH